MRNLISVVVVALCACTPEDVVAKVGSRVVTREDVKRSPGGLEPLLDREVLANVALQHGLNQRPEVKARMATLEREVLAQAALDEAMATIDEAALKAEFDADKARFVRRSAHVAQVFFSAPVGAAKERAAEAQSRAARAWARLQGGDDFATVARETSEDSATKERGGDVGVLVEGQVDPVLFKAVEALAPGGYSTPITSAVGLHIFKLLEPVKIETRSFDDVKAQLRAELVARMQASVLEKAKRSVKVTQYPEHFAVDGGGR